MKRFETLTLDASQTALECSPYCSTSGSMLVVMMRCARLKFESISVGLLVRWTGSRWLRAPYPAA